MSEESVGLFDYLNDITANKNRLADRDEEFEKNYLPFMILRGLAGNVGDVLWANEINLYPSAITKRMHYDFLYYTLKQGRRYGKWLKESKNDEIVAIMEYYQIRRAVAEDMIDLMSREEIDHALTFKGGKIR